MPGGTIPDSIIEEIKDRSDIVEVIGEHVSLSPSGKNYKGLCPFHDEKTPSFMVSRDRKMFKCFGCNVAGDVFTFLMKRENMSYPEAVRTLAERYGVAIPESSGESGKYGKLRDQLVKLNNFAVEYYENMLLKSPAGKKALTYLKKRGIENNIIQSFKLGFSLSSWDDFLKAGKKADFSEAIMLRGGFILQGKKGSYYDRFRGRIMFPIFDPRGKPMAFGGRIVDDTESEAKYINSPETPIYSKSRSLYNLNLARESIQKEGCAILAEGYMDVITCFQAGVHNIIASLGTSLTEGHVRLLKRYTDEVVIAYDSDKAGSSATSRGLDMLIKGDLRVKILTLPSGKDPDDFIRENSVESFRNLVSQSANLLDYKLDKARDQVDVNTAEGKKLAAKAVITTLANMNNQLERSEYVKRCAEKLNVEEDFIWQQLRSIGAGKRVERSTQPKIKATPKRSAKENIERDLIECLLQFPQFIPQARAVLGKEDFSNAGHAELIELLWTGDLEGRGLKLADLINKCTNRESRDILSNMILRNSPPSDSKANFDGEAQFNGCMKKMVEFRERDFRRSLAKEGNDDSISIAKQLWESYRKQNSTTKKL